MRKDLNTSYVILVVRNILSLKPSPELEQFLGRLEELSPEGKGVVLEYCYNIPINSRTMCIKEVKVPIKGRHYLSKLLWPEFDSHYKCD